jgi:malate dehydrogenase
MKITVIGGAGNVGATCAQILANKEIAEDIVLFDVNESVCNGRGLDMYQSMPILSSSSRLLPTANYADTANSDIVVITAGIARKPGMSRDDLLKTNAGIVSSCAEQAVKHSPNAIFVIVSNPLDVMTYVAIQKSKLPRNKVIGMAGILDAARFRTFLAMEIGVSPKDIQALVLGGHGDTMVPLPRYTTVGGIPITDFVKKDRLDAICERTANGGGEIVKFLQTGSAWYAPGTAAAEIVEAIVRNQKRIMPCTVLLDGEYGYKDVCVGVPIIIGKNGIEKIVELNLTADEKALFDKSATHVKETIKEGMDLLK